MIFVYGLNVLETSRLKRGLDRDGEHARSLWEDDWMQEEDRYIALCHPHLQAHKIIQGMST